MVRWVVGWLAGWLEGGDGWKVGKGGRWGWIEGGDGWKVGMDGWVYYLSLDSVAASATCSASAQQSVREQ